MDGDRVSINIGNDEISWEQRRARLKALESVKGTRLEAEFKSLVYLQLRDTVKEGNVDKFIEALEKHSAQERLSLSDIISIQGPSGNSLLHVAAGIEEAAILRALLEIIRDKGLAAKVNYRGDTALHIAARAGRIRMAELLLGCGNIVDMANDTGNTALHEAVKSRHYELTRLLLSRGSRSVYKKNKESKSPLYLAVEMGDMKNLMLLMEAVEGHEVLPSEIEGISPVHGAVIHKKIDMLKEMLKRKKDLFNLRDSSGGTPLHLAALMNYVVGVKFLVDEVAWSAYVGDEEGYLPIHVACKMGHLETIKVLLQNGADPKKNRADPEELLDLKEGQNILHVAAKYGQDLVVGYIITNSKFVKLINAKDKEGNTPLHVATLQLRATVLTFLVLQGGVDLQLVNNGNLTALDIAYEQRKKSDGLREKAICTILSFAGAPRSDYNAICQPKGMDSTRDSEDLPLDRLKDVANTRMLVATIIAGMTFAAGLSVPGGYNGSGPDAGFATLLNKPMYDVFVICNTVGLYSSIIAVAILHWAETSSFDKMVRDLSTARTSVVLALAATSVAYMAGVCVTVSKRAWIAAVALIAGITALFVILSLHIICTPGNLLKFLRVEMSIVRRLIPILQSWSEKMTKLRARQHTRRQAVNTLDDKPRLPEYPLEILEDLAEPLPNVGGERGMVRIE